MVKAKSSHFLDSMFDALSIGNILYRIFLFVAFGLIVATPYVIKNLDEVSASGGGFMAFFFALTGATMKGVIISLSTVGVTIKSYFAGDFVGVGTLIFSVFALIGGTLFVYQPIRLFMNVIDGEKDRKDPVILVFFISIAFTLLIFVPISTAIMGGDTITSGVVDNDNIIVSDNIVSDNSSEEVIVNSINMLNGGVVNET